MTSQSLFAGKNTKKKKILQNVVCCQHIKNEDNLKTYQPFFFQADNLFTCICYYKQYIVHSQTSISRTKKVHLLRHI